MSLNTRKQRNHLYSLVFLKWSVERRLSTLQQGSIETSLAVLHFGNEATEANYKQLAEKLSDFETMQEVAEETFPALRADMDRIKKEKLLTLKMQTKIMSGKGTEKEKEEKAAKVPYQIREKKSFVDQFSERLNSLFDI